MVASRRSTVGSMPLFHPAEVGSNPGEGWVAPNIPNPPLCPLVVVLCLVVVVSIGRAYLKVHGGPAPRRASTSSRAVANRGGAGAGQQHINSCCSWLAAVVGPHLLAMHTGWSVVVGLVAVILPHRQRSILEVHGCFVPWSVGSMPAARRVDDGAGGRLLYPLFWHIVVAL